MRPLLEINEPTTSDADYIAAAPPGDMYSLTELPKAVYTIERVWVIARVSRQPPQARAT